MTFRIYNRSFSFSHPRSPPSHSLSRSRFLSAFLDIPRSPFFRRFALPSLSYSVSGTSLRFRREYRVLPFFFSLTANYVGHNRRNTVMETSLFLSGFFFAFSLWQSKRRETKSLCLVSTFVLPFSSLVISFDFYASTSARTFARTRSKLVGAI